MDKKQPGYVKFLKILWGVFLLSGIVLLIIGISRMLWHDMVGGPVMVGIGVFVLAIIVPPLTPVAFEPEFTTIKLKKRLTFNKKQNKFKRKCRQGKLT